MKKMLFVLAILMVFSVSMAFADSIALKALWTPNTDTVTTGYKLYRTDGGRTLIGAIPGKTPTQPYLFSITVPAASSGTATFVMTATSATKESADSVTIPYPFDLTPTPAVPVGAVISNQ
jgi:hypothetical protein